MLPALPVIYHKSSGFLPEEDHGNRYVVSAAGIFAVALEHAAQATGKILVTSPVEDLDPAGAVSRGPQVVVATARLVGDCPANSESNILERRRTSRLPYQA